MEATIARDGSGTYSLPQAAFVNGTTIDATAVNSDFSDIASALTQSLSKDGQTTPTGNQPMATYRHTGVGAATARTDYARADQVIGSVLDYAADTGTADALAIAPSPGIAAYVVGQSFTIKKIASANATTTPTLAINGLTAGTITWPDGTALAAGDLPSGALFEVKVAATTPVFHLQTQTKPASFTASSTSTLTNKTFDTAGTGNVFYAPMVPQGRLSLATATPVMTSAQTAKTTVYYCLYTGNLVPIYDSTSFKWTVFAELSNDLTASSTGKAGPAAATTNSNYDLFVWSDSGTIRLTRGPAWTSDTGRGTGAGTTELQRINGIWTNKVAITNGPGANLGTYVGTIRTDGSSQANWTAMPSAAAGGAEAKLHVFNAYNRVRTDAASQDNTSSWTYGTATWRSLNNSTANRISYIDGLGELSLVAALIVGVNQGSGGIVHVGINRDSTSASPVPATLSQIGATNGSPVVRAPFAPSLGYHYLQAMEAAGSGISTTLYGNGTVGMANQFEGLSAEVVL